jgi:glycosyltransferase involved in cell wall biosynthesis
MRISLENQVKENALEDRICFMGAVPFSNVFDHYEWSDILILASETEGWPKSIAEGMAFGLLCIGSDRGLVPQMLGDHRGITVVPGNAAVLVDAIFQIYTQPESFLQVRRNAAVWAHQFTLEGLRVSIANLLSKEWWGKE